MFVPESNPDLQELIKLELVRLVEYDESGVKYAEITPKGSNFAAMPEEFGFLPDGQATILDDLANNRE